MKTNTFHTLRKLQLRSKEIQIEIQNVLRELDLEWITQKNIRRNLINIIVFLPKIILCSFYNILSICRGILMKKTLPKLLSMILLTGKIPWMPFFRYLVIVSSEFLQIHISGLNWVILYIPYFQDIPRKVYNLVETDRKWYKSCSIVNPMWARIPWMSIFQISCYHFKQIPSDISGTLKLCGSNWIIPWYPIFPRYPKKILQSCWNGLKMLQKLLFCEFDVSHLSEGLLAFLNCLLMVEEGGGMVWYGMVW